MPFFDSTTPPPLRSELPELAALEQLLDLVSRAGVPAEASPLTRVRHQGRDYPVYGVVLGRSAPTDPIFMITGGVHGLERIGSQVVIAYLTTLLRQLQWDTLLRESLERTRIALVPLVNPVGMALRRRGNGNGVDLMRNAPPHPDGRGTPLVGGQRWSPWLPWYMGRDGEPMQAEAQALVDFVEELLYPSRDAVCIDVHSGFGMVDRLWFPYARTRQPIPHLPEMFAMRTLLDHTLPNHVYRIEPQAQTYTVQGDLWDHLYDGYIEHQPEGVFLPLTLEMGSWLWVKKNPRQLLSVLGSFNPMVPHRLRRTLRRHLLLFDFLYRASASPAAWSRHEPDARSTLADQAFRAWYGR